MKLFIGGFMALVAMLIGSPLLALFMGSLLIIVFKFPNNLISASLGSNFLQLSIILIGVSISASDAIELTSKYFIYISIFVICTFLVGIIFVNLFKIDKKAGLLLASGTAICGATAMAAISPLIKAKPKDLLICLAIIFIFNAISMIFFPLFGKSIGMSNEIFGAWVSMAIHDTSSVIGAAVAFGGSAVEPAATLKLGRTLWLIPLIITIGFFYKNDSQIKFPVFILIFILAVISGTFIDLGQSLLFFLDYLSEIFLLAALFCVGTQMNYESTKAININIFLTAFCMWIFALLFSYLLISFFIK